MSAVEGRHQQKFTQSFVAPNYKMSEMGLASVLMLCDVSFQATILKPELCLTVRKVCWIII
jgi:hypothetical protein